MPATSPPIALPVAAAVTSVLAAVLVPPAVPSAALAERWLRPVPGEVARTFHYSRGAPFTPGAHRGVDLAAPPGTAVRSACAGRVVYAGSGLRGYGNLVILKHNATYLTAYAHNQTLLVKDDQNVKRGQKIAEMGSTDADGVQLHFEIRKQGKPIDPARLLPAR